MKKDILPSDDVRGGALKGLTDDTDYFYFICPQCPDQRIMRVLDYKVEREEPKNRYDAKSKSKSGRSFVIRFELFCEECELKDATKISNLGWQGGIIKS